MVVVAMMTVTAGPALAKRPAQGIATARANAEDNAGGGAAGQGGGGQGGINNNPNFP